MTEPFVKLFSSITTSTIWREDSDTRIVWVTMLAIADRTGYVGASLPGLASTANVSLEACETALARFMAPDKHSRNQEHEGRRIEAAFRGWQILNYEFFRNLRDTEAIRAYERERKAAQREGKESGTVPASPGKSQSVPKLSPQAEAELEAEAVSQKKEQMRPPLRGSRLPPDFPTNELKEWAAAKRADLSPVEESDKFCDYWTAKAGKEGVKLDWAATWRNWVRNANAQKVDVAKRITPSPECPPEPPELAERRYREHLQHLGRT
jgi:hypothetical protein